MKKNRTKTNRVLQYVIGHPGCTNRAILKLLDCKHYSDANHFLKRLEDQKLIFSKPIKIDGVRPGFAWYDIKLQKVTTESVTSMKW